MQIEYPKYKPFVSGTRPYYGNSLRFGVSTSTIYNACKKLGYLLDNKVPMLSTIQAYRIGELLGYEDKYITRYAVAEGYIEPTKEIVRDIFSYTAGTDTYRDYDYEYLNDYLKDEKYLCNKCGKEKLISDKVFFYGQTYGLLDEFMCRDCVKSAFNQGSQVIPAEHNT